MIRLSEYSTVGRGISGTSGSGVAPHRNFREDRQVGDDGLGAAVALYGGQFPPMEAIKALGYFEVDDARNVDATTRDLLTRAAADWICDVSAISRFEDRRLGP